MPRASVSRSASRPKSLPTAAAAPNGPCVPGLWNPRTVSSPTAVRAMRAETSNPAASAVRHAAPVTRSRSATASAAGSTVPLACEPVSGSHSNAPMRTPLAKAARATSVRQPYPMTDASAAPPRSRTTATIRRAQGWAVPTKPAPSASRRAILQFSTSPRGKSSNPVSATKRARARVSFMLVLSATVATLVRGSAQAGRGRPEPVTAARPPSGPRRIHRAGSRTRPGRSGTSPAPGGRSAAAPRAVSGRRAPCPPGSR